MPSSFSFVTRLTAVSTLTTLTNGFVYEFLKDPLPQSSSFWLLGQVTVSNDAYGGNSTTANSGSVAPEIRFELRTALDAVKDVGSLEGKLQDVAVGIVPTWIIEHSSKDIACCGGPDAVCEGTEFSLASAKSPHKDSVFMVSLHKATSSSDLLVLNPNQGSYYFVLANCAKDTTGIALAGTVKVRNKHGYVPVENILADRISFIVGIPYLLLCGLFFLYPIGGDLSNFFRGLGAFAGIAAMRLLVVHPYTLGQWNLLGDGAFGKGPEGVIFALQSAILFWLWDQLHSQYSLADRPASTTDHLLRSVLVIAVASLGFLSMTAGGSGSPLRATETFLRAASSSTSDNDSTSGSGPNAGAGSWFSASSSLSGDDWAYLAGVLCTLAPALSWSERHLSTHKSTEFSMRVTEPLRSKVTGLLALTLSFLVLRDVGIFGGLGATAPSSIPPASAIGISSSGDKPLDSSSSTLGSFMGKLPGLQPSVLQFLNVTDTVLPEGAVLASILWTGFYVVRFHRGQISGSHSGNYGVISGVDEVELGAVEDPDVQADVDSYDPDKLEETRVRLE